MDASSNAPAGGGPAAPPWEPSVLHLVMTRLRRGAEVFAADLSAGLERRGVPSRTVALAGGGPSEHVLPIDVLGPRPMAPATLRALRGAAATVDVVVAHGSRTLDACAVALAGTGTPFVYRSIGDPAAWSSAGWHRLRTAALLRRAALVAVYWQGAADTVAAAHGVPRSKLVVIPKGVPAHEHPVPSPQARVAARARLGLPAEAPVVACIGALSAEKRVSAAIEAVARLPDVHLLVAGDGAERAALGQRAAIAPGRVHFAGVLPGPGEALAAADAVVLSSRTEGMPGVLIEAGLAGLPSVAMAVGGVTEVVEDGVTGVLVPPGLPDHPGALAAGLRTALASADAMGAAARVRCLERFDMAVVTGRWADALRSLTAGRNGHRGGASPIR